MSEYAVGLAEITPIEIEGLGLPKPLRKRLLDQDNSNLERDALRMRNEWLQAERDEIVEYVRTLKKLAIYMNEKTSSSVKFLPRINFDRVEQNLPEYLRKEIEVNTSSQ